MDPVMSAIIGEAFKFGFQQAAMWAAGKNLTPEQIQAQAEIEWQKFQENKPELLPDV